MIIKKIILLTLLAVPSFVMAQSEWEIPESAKSQKEATAKKTMSDTPEKQGKVDAKYGVGTVPVVDGKVIWEKEITLPGASAEVLYDRTLNAITELTRDKNQLDGSRIVAVNKHDRVIAAAMNEELVFQNAILSKDFTEMKYTIIASCRDGAVNIQFCRISYLYDKGRQTESSFKAEEWITDKESLNRKGTRLLPGSGKFRRKTIDRKDEVFNFIESALSANN